MKTIIFALLVMMLMIPITLAAETSNSASSAYAESYMANMRRLMGGYAAADMRADSYQMRHEYCDEHHNCWLDSDRSKMEEMKKRDERREVERFISAFGTPVWIA